MAKGHPKGEVHGRTEYNFARSKIEQPKAARRAKRRDALSNPSARQTQIFAIKNGMFLRC